MMDGLRRATREAAISLRVHAEVTARKMDRLLAEAERLVSELERDEARLAAHAPLPANRQSEVAEPANLNRP